MSTVLKGRRTARLPWSNLVEDNGGALPGHAVLPVIVGGVHGRAAEHAGDGAGSVRAVIGDA
eukprot:CAMPEP_0174922622 /NCGR_PEP_ID=MMETSP1355-20121228/6008_1 /TAXON_ID=464990 /ORGANISM="Hemiselmis tepida, Strain CCMP443" /LENGTH=61 /DNA_ID=CAMNT_0016168231 /DNA_START=146 /DNA_END=328 /DNA_ORIENTATION=+